MTAAGITRCLLPACCLAFLTACAPRSVALPTGAGAPFPGYRAAFDEATQACRDVRTLAALVGLSGRAGGTRLRGRIEAGFAAPGMVRLDALAPFGSRPVFTLVSRNGEATLWLPRDGRVLTDAPTEAVIEALAGVALGPDDLRAVVAGCGFHAAVPVAGRVFGDDWAALQDGETTLWLRRTDAAWRLVAASRGPLEVRYQEYAQGRPSTVRLRTTAGSPADITLTLSEVDVNIELEPQVFEVRVPDGAVPLTLQELRRAGPLGASGER